MSANLLIQCNGYGYIVNDNAMYVVISCGAAEGFLVKLRTTSPRGNPVPHAKPRKSALNSCHMMFSSSRKLVVVIGVVVVVLLLHHPLSPFPFPLKSCSLSWSSTGRADNPRTAPALPHTYAVHYRSSPSPTDSASSTPELVFRMHSTISQEERCVVRQVKVHGSELRDSGELDHF